MTLVELSNMWLEEDPKYRNWYALPDGITREEVAVLLLLGDALRNHDNGCIFIMTGNPPLERIIFGPSFDSKYNLHIPNLRRFIHQLGDKS